MVRDGQLGMGHVGGRRRRQLLTSMRFDSSLVTQTEYDIVQIILTQTKLNKYENKTRIRAIHSDARRCATN